MQSEANGIGTIREHSDEILVVENKDDLLYIQKNEIPSETPIVIPLYRGSPEERVQQTINIVNWVYQNGEQLYANGRRSVILDSFSDVNSNIVDALGAKTGNIVQMKDWQQIKVHCLHRVLEPLRQLTDMGLDLLVTCGLQDNSMEDGMVDRGYKSVIQGAARAQFLYRLMAGCQLESLFTVNRQTKEVEGLRRTALFNGRPGYHVCKTKGALERESINFTEWKAKAFPNYNGVLK